MKRWLIPPVPSGSPERNVVWIETRALYETRFGHIRSEEAAARVGERNAEKYRRRFRDGRPVRPTEGKFAWVHGERGGARLVSFDGDCRIVGASLAGVDRVPVVVSFVDFQTREAVDLSDDWEGVARRALVGRNP